MTGNFRNIVFLLLVCILAISCQNINKADKPDNLIPEDKMIDILTELSLVNAARNFNKQKLEDLGINPDEYIYNKYKIDSLQFERSSDYYADNYLQYDRMYDSVKVRVERLKTKLDSIRDIEIAIRDSIALVKKDSTKVADSLRDIVKMDSLEIEKFMNERFKVKDSLLRKNDSLKKQKDSLIAPPALINADDSQQ